MVAQALRSTFPIDLGVTNEFVHIMDDCEETDALITKFKTLSNTTGESCPIEEEEAVRTLVTWKHQEKFPVCSARDG